MEVTLYIPDERSTLYGDDPVAVTRAAQAVLDKETMRLWHVERCKPKPKNPPPEQFNEAEWKRMVMEGEDLFIVLYRHAGPNAYADVYGRFEERFLALRQARDFKGLKEFLEKKEWQRRR